MGERGLAPKLEQQGAASRTGSCKKGFAFLTPWPRLNTQRAGALLPATQNLGSAPGPLWGPEGAGASEQRIPRDVALPSLCRETEWCAQGCPGTAATFLQLLPEPKASSAQPDRPPPPQGMEPEALEEASDCSALLIKVPLGPYCSLRRVWLTGSVSGTKASKSHKGVLSPPFH